MPKPDTKDGLFAVGLVLLVIGLWMIYRPLAFIVPGSLLIAFAYVTAGSVKKVSK